MLARARWIYLTLVLLAVLGTSKWPSPATMERTAMRSAGPATTGTTARDPDAVDFARIASAAAMVLVEVSFPHANPRSR